MKCCRGNAYPPNRSWAQGVSHSSKQCYPFHSSTKKKNKRQKSDLRKSLLIAGRTHWLWTVLVLVWIVKLIGPLFDRSCLMNISCWQGGNWLHASIAAGWGEWVWGKNSFTSFDKGDFRNLPEHTGRRQAELELEHATLHVLIRTTRTIVGGDVCGVSRVLVGLGDS